MIDPQAIDHNIDCRCKAVAGNLMKRKLNTAHIAVMEPSTN